MPNDALTQSKGTSNTSTGAGPGNRGTAAVGVGRVRFEFLVPVNREIEKAHAAPTKIRDFHLAVWGQIFGPGLHKSGYVMYGGFDSLLPRLAGPSKTLPTKLRYELPKTIVDRIGIISRIKPTRVTRDGAEVIGEDHFVEQSGLIEQLYSGPSDLQTILHRNIGFDLAEADVWRDLGPGRREEALWEVRRAVTLLGEIDDAARVSLIGLMPNERRRRRGEVVRFDLSRIRRFNAQLEELKLASESRARKSELLEYDAALDTGSLIGCHKLYFLRKDYYAAPIDFKSSEVKLGNTYKAKAPKPSSLRMQLEAQYLRLMHEKGFRHDTLDKRISLFEKGFEKRAANFARKILMNYRRIFEYHARKTNVPELIAAIRAHHGILIRDIVNAKTLISPDRLPAALAHGDERLKKLSRDYPILTFANFWTIYAKSHEFLDGKFSIAHFRKMIAETRAAIREMLSDLKSDSSEVWKGEKVIGQALTQFGMYADPKTAQSHNAMLTEIVQQKMARERRKKLWTGIFLAIASLALSLTGVGALVTVGAVISLVDVYLMIDDRQETINRNLTGFSDQRAPSDFWVLLAVAGVGADVAGLARLLSAPKNAALVRSADGLLDVLGQAEITTGRVIEAAEAARLAKLRLDDAEAAVRKLANPLSQASGVRHLEDIAVELARLRLKDFKHFLLELSHQKALKAVPDSDDIDVLRAALDPALEQALARIWEAGIRRAQGQLAKLDELIEAANDVGQEARTARAAASDFWHKHRKHAKRSDPNSPFHTRAEEHYAMKRHAKRLELKEQALAAEVRLLRPRDGQAATRWGYDAEAAIKYLDGWPELGSNLKAVDSIQLPGVKSGFLELMQSKAVVDPLESQLIGKAKGKIREAVGVIDADKWARLRRGIAEGSTPLPKEFKDLQLPKNWRDPSVRFNLEVPVVTSAKMDLDSVKKAVMPLFEKNFPANAVLNLRLISKDEIVDALHRASEALE